MQIRLRLKYDARQPAYLFGAISSKIAYILGHFLWKDMNDDYFEDLISIIAEIPPGLLNHKSKVRFRLYFQWELFTSEFMRYCCISKS